MTARERPILFSDEMARAILDGRKSQTRRVVKLTEKGMAVLRASHATPLRHGVGLVWRPYSGAPEQPMPSDKVAEYCPHGAVGERLWVREAFALVPCSAGCERYPDGFDPKKSSASQPGAPQLGVRYRATWDKSLSTPWRASIHMPRWASRITLEITDVRVERVQDISEEDARAEGAEAAFTRTVYPGTGAAAVNSHRFGFVKIWDCINGKRPNCSWKDNPFVWVISFRRVEQP